MKMLLLDSLIAAYLKHNQNYSLILPFASFRLLRLASSCYVLLFFDGSTIIINFFFSFHVSWIRVVRYHVVHKCNQQSLFSADIFYDGALLHRIASILLRKMEKCSLLSIHQRQKMRKVSVRSIISDLLPSFKRLYVSSYTII